VGTTLTIEDDVGGPLCQEMQRKGMNLKPAVNRFPGSGLKQAPQSPGKSFTVKPIRMEFSPDGQMDSIGRLLERLEGAERK